MKFISDLLHPPKTFRFDEYKTVDELQIPQDVYDKILSTVDASVSKSRCSQGVVIVEKIKGISKKDIYRAQDVIPFPYTYDDFFSNDDLEQVIDHIKPDKGYRIGFIYHIINNDSEILLDRLYDIKTKTERLIAPKPQSYEDYYSNPSKPVLNSAGDCGHLWIKKKDDDLFEFKALLPYDKVPICLFKKRFTGEETRSDNHPRGIRDVRYLKIDSPGDISQTSIFPNF